MALPNKEEWSTWDFNLRVAAKRVEGISSHTFYGNNPDIDGVLEDVWGTGGVLQFLSSSETMDIVSTSTDDDGNPEGTGAHRIAIRGLDDNYTPISEIVTLDGTSVVVTTQSYFRVNRMIILSAGSNDTNVGDISATATTAGTIQAEIKADNGVTTKSQLTVPENKRFFITSLSLGTQNNDEVQINIQSRIESGPWIVIYRTNIVSNSYKEQFIYPPSIPSKADLRIQGINLGMGSGVAVSSFMQFLLVDNELVSNKDIFQGF